MQKILNPTQGLTAPLGYMSPNCIVIGIDSENALCTSTGFGAGFRGGDLGDEIGINWEEED